MDTMMLRRATQVDAAALGRLHVAAWHETYTGIIPDKMLAGLSGDARAAMWDRILGNPDDFGSACVLVAEDGGRMIGFGCCGRQRDKSLRDAGFSGEFTAIYVLRSHQGRGIGRSIMAAMSRELSAAGHTTACLWVLRGNAPARAFYGKLGGVIMAEKTDKRPSATLVEDAYGWRDLSFLDG